MSRKYLVGTALVDFSSSMLIDDDKENRAMEGLLGLQLHQGPPMIVEFRNIYLKNL